MKKKPIARKKTAPAKRSGVTKAKPDGLTPLVTEVRHLIQAARGGVVSVVNTFQVMTNFEIGRRIVEHEQKGEKRAAYGAEVVKELSTRLTEEFGRGFSKANLEYMRRFYLEWQSRVPAIAQTSSGQFMPNEIGQKPSDKLEIAQTPPDHRCDRQSPAKKAFFPASRGSTLAHSIAAARATAANLFTCIHATLRNDPRRLSAAQPSVVCRPQGEAKRGHALTRDSTALNHPAIAPPTRSEPPHILAGRPIVSRSASQCISSARGVRIVVYRACLKKPP